jgi:CheY-like chemotaxis protein/anti-sigma regulatory factor (Ser/Thr protein kinase)
VQASGDALLELINDILDFSRIESGKLDLEHIPFDLREMLGDTMKSLGIRAHKKGLERAYSVSTRIPEYLIGDPARLRQIVVNLVGNAIKFTETGEVVLRVTSGEVVNSETVLQFSVTDTGIGVPEEKIADIFEAFQQADTSTTRSYGGTGLGLAISRRLVDMMDGVLECRSEVGVGSTFSFTARCGIASDRVKRIRRDPATVTGTRVMIVDDNQTNRRILFEMCSNWGMQPIVATGADEAIRLLRTAQDEGHQFQLILSDVNMPQIDGFTMTEQIRAIKEFNNVRIIMLTSSGRPGDAQRRKDLGIEANLLKPVKQSELFDAIASALAPAAAASATISQSFEERQHRAGLSILLAEDNLVNQKLAVGILSRLGHHVSVAANGAEAVAACKDQTFDVILMDVQMPVMDGFEATGIIREQQMQSGKRVPIIAMTAHAMKGDRERCLEAGMDEYLSKPIRARQLSEMLDSMAPSVTDDGSTELAASAESGQSAEPSGAEVPAESQMDWDEALAGVDGDRSLLKLVLEAFMQEHQSLLKQIRDAAAADDTAVLKRAAHTMKGALISIGAVQPARTAQRIEEMKASDPVSGVSGAIETLSSQVTTLIRELQRYLANGD